MKIWILSAVALFAMNAFALEVNDMRGHWVRVGVRCAGQGLIPLDGSWIFDIHENVFMHTSGFDGFTASTYGRMKGTDKGDRLSIELVDAFSADTKRGETTLVDIFWNLLNKPDIVTLRTEQDGMYLVMGMSPEASNDPGCKNEEFVYIAR